MDDRARTGGRLRGGSQDRRVPGRRRRRRSTLVVAVAGGLLALTAPACGNLTAGGATGSVGVAVSGDAPDEGGVSPSPARLVGFSQAAGPASGPDAAPPGRRRVRGQVSATLRVSLVDDDGEAVPLLDEGARAEVDIQGETEARLGAREVDVGLYPRIRVVFTDIEADVRSGLVVGGTPVEGRVGVGEDLDSLVVEIDTAVEVVEGREVELLIDLNSTAWLNAANPALKTVASRVFRNHVSVRVR